MSTYLFVYRAPLDRRPPSPEVKAEWESYFAELGDALVRPGEPIMTAAAAGEVGEPRPLSGYTVVEAEDLASAITLAERSPVVSRGGGVEVGEITPTSGLTAQAAGGAGAGADPR